jgi:hypothetical protein
MSNKKTLLALIILLLIVYLLLSNNKENMNNKKSNNQVSYTTTDIEKCFTSCSPIVNNNSTEVLCDSESNNISGTMCNDIFKYCECEQETNQNSPNYNLIICKNKNCKDYQNYLNVNTCNIQCTPEASNLKTPLNCLCSPETGGSCPTLEQQKVYQEMCNNLYTECGCGYKTQNITTDFMGKKYTSSEQTYVCNNNNVCQSFKNDLIQNYDNQ